MSKLRTTLYFLRTRIFLINLGLALGLLFLLLTIIYLGLSSYTNHGKSIVVPDFKGQTASNLDEFIKDKKLSYKIVDSIYNPKQPQGSIIDQEPGSGAKVKEGRTIYLTINSQIPPQIKMPNLVDVSDRQAEAILQTYGLKMGHRIMKPDLAKNAVLDQLINGHSVKAGTDVRVGSIVDLVLGDGFGNTQIPVPSLVGKGRDEAFFILQASSLVMGKENYDETVKGDTLNARVYRQIPEYTPENTISQGESVQLFFTKDENKWKAALPHE